MTPTTPTPVVKRRTVVRRVLIPLLLVLVVGGGAFGFSVYWQGAHYVSTDNAQVSGQPITVGALNAGRVLGVKTTVGATVRQGEIVAEVQIPTIVGTFQDGSPRYAFLDSTAQTVDVQSPVTGIVLAVPAAVGATVAQGQTLVEIIDPAHLWITANVDETDVERVRVGQTAQVHFDALNATLPGKVSEVTPATAGSFSLLPQPNTTANFTKVGQVVPVTISVDLGDRTGLLGSSASVRIRVQ